MVRRPSGVWRWCPTISTSRKPILGDRLSDPRAAIQKGRRIAAIRTPELGISITLALMTPARAEREAGPMGCGLSEAIRPDNCAAS